MQKEYSFWKGFKKGLTAVFVFGGSFLLSQIPQAFGDMTLVEALHRGVDLIGNRLPVITVGGALAIGFNAVKFWLQKKNIIDSE